MKARVLVIGSGAREDALAVRMSQSPHVGEIFIAPGNGGTAKRFRNNVSIQPHKLTQLAEFAENRHIDLTVVGPEVPLGLGIVDCFREHELPIFGPTAEMARLETSKLYGKRVMQTRHVPTAPFTVIEGHTAAMNFLTGCFGNTVVKVDWLAAGKGVYVCQTREEVAGAIEEIFVKKVHGEGNGIVIVERLLTGPEFSIHAVCDGRNALLFPASRDHKRLLTGNKGPNTGGMGAFAPVPGFTEGDMQGVLNRIVTPVMAATKYQGLLYPGLMLSDGKIMVLEINVRGGDPETEPLMMLFEGDLFELLQASAEGKLDTVTPAWYDGFAVCVVLASREYPGKCATGHLITGIEEAERLPNVCVFHAGTQYEGGKFYTAGGRVLAVTARGATLAEARSRAYTAVSCINFDGMQFRSDIAADA